MFLRGNISHIARTSLHDGPGIRTVVYFKGCGMHCRWCHNPETLSAENEILYTKTKCIHCGRCVAVCPTCHKVCGDVMEFVRDDCRKCGKCAEVCPTGALTVCGKNMSVADVMSQIRKDRCYYTQSGGGITLSGGECLLQAEFCAELLKHCKEEDIHTAIESALFVQWKQVEKVIPLCDFFFVDFKIADAAKHKQYTGQDNRLILENLEKLVRCGKYRVTVRIPLIPGVNDAPEDIVQFAEKLKQVAGDLAGIEVLRYNPLAESKYTQVGKKYCDFGQPQSDQFLLDFCESLEAALANKTKVYSVL